MKSKIDTIFLFSTLSKDAIIGETKDLSHRAVSFANTKFDNKFLVYKTRLQRVSINKHINQYIIKPNYQIPHPPSITIFCPVTYKERSLAKYAVTPLKSSSTDILCNGVRPL